MKHEVVGRINCQAFQCNRNYFETDSSLINTFRKMELIKMRKSRYFPRNISSQNKYQVNLYMNAYYKRVAGFMNHILPLFNQIIKHHKLL